MNTANRRLAYVIDDGIVERMLGKALLEKMHFAVLPFATAEEALARIVSEPPILVVCDMRLPELDGLTLHGRIIEACRERRLPVPAFLLCSADVPNHLPSSAPAPFLSLQKPLSVECLRTALESFGLNGEEPAAQRA